MPPKAIYFSLEIDENNIIECLYFLIHSTRDASETNVRRSMMHTIRYSIVFSNIQLQLEGCLKISE